MKLLYSFILLVLLSACKEKKEIDSNIIPQKTEVGSNDSVSKSNLEVATSLIRPKEELKRQKIYSDIAEFVEYDEMGEFPLFIVKKNNEIISLATNLEKDPKYTRGDIFEMKWKIDSLMVGGEEGVSFTEWLVDAKKIKDGSVSLFRKKYKKPIKYYWGGEEDTYTTEYKDYLYTLVEYYLANSKVELVKVTIKNPDANLIYSIEDGEKEGRSYTVLGISNDFEHHTNIIQWLYVDRLTKELYEYDLASDKLIKFN
ncbi:hypothetical protein OIU83_08180 [Flavobacterium sp. LS1R49]|uniref:Lipoprotein n=1 Tax=Flavobacterium shii TaxID=2987687 RepID=A0A9X2ZH66_9FLAO|nr:hypothetical protein [Flavobacterium shii]MCV9927623.1 hypothetical protein [Flavobacterium shii]